MEHNKLCILPTVHIKPTGYNGKNIIEGTWTGFGHSVPQQIEGDVIMQVCEVFSCVHMMATVCVHMMATVA